jgi:hypothetical protein
MPRFRILRADFASAIPRTDKIEEMRKKLLTGTRMSKNGAKTSASGRPRCFSNGGVELGVEGGYVNGGGGGPHRRRNGSSGGGGRQPGGGGEGPEEELFLGEMIGEGTFGKVYKGGWGLGTREVRSGEGGERAGC